VREVVLLADALEDLEDSADYLEARDPGAEHRFLAEVHRAMSRVSDNPHVGPALGNGVHRLGLRRFSYNVYYRVEPARVVVFAILHQRRDPRVWQRRL
jgi:plasmid stabilization system protein ParE